MKSKIAIRSAGTRRMLTCNAGKCFTDMIASESDRFAIAWKIGIRPRPQAEIRGLVAADQMDAYEMPVIAGNLRLGRKRLTTTCSESVIMHRMTPFEQITMCRCD